VVYDAIVTDCEAAERLVHAMLEGQRVNPRREFFRTSLYDAIKAVRAAEEKYPPDSDGGDSEREILPELEQSMRQWLRQDLVSVRFVQYPDLCVLKVTVQPDPMSDRAVEQIYDLRVLGEDDEVGDGLVFSPSRAIHENIRTLVHDLDPYSMVMVGMPLLSPDVENQIAAMRESGAEPPLRPSWHATSRVLDMWGPEDEWRPIVESLGLEAT
jgi:hypothetical protein